MQRISILAVLIAAACAVAPAPSTDPAPEPMRHLETRLEQVILRHTAGGGEIAVAFMDLERGDSLLINARTPMHAASTMKVPVMIQLFRLADAGELALDQTIPVRNSFRSIADGSTYALSVEDDSEHTLYARSGSEVQLDELIELMISRSSNLATNLLIELADPARIAQTQALLGATEMRALRGVEDIPAFERGMNNTTTAYGFMKTLEAIARGRAASPAATARMIEILERQEFRELIAAGVPPGTRVANKTGWISGIDHDGAIVFPRGRAPYVLVVLTRGFAESALAAAAAGEISAVVFEFAADARISVGGLRERDDPLIRADAGAAAVQRTAG